MKLLSYSCHIHRWLIVESNVNSFRLVYQGFFEFDKVTYTPGYKQQPFGKNLHLIPPIIVLSTQDRNINFIATHNSSKVFKRIAHSKKISEHELGYHSSSVQPNGLNNMACCHIPMTQRCDPKRILVSLPGFFLTNWSLQSQTELYTPEHNAHRYHLQLQNMTAAINSCDTKGKFGSWVHRHCPRSASVKQKMKS